MSTRVPSHCLHTKKVVTAMQKYIVPWSIALEGLSYAKSLSLDVVKAMLIVIIDAEHLMPGHTDCAAEARKHSVALADFAKRVKNAAGLNDVVFSIITHLVVLSVLTLFNHEQTTCQRPCRMVSGQAPYLNEGCPHQTL